MQRFAIPSRVSRSLGALGLVAGLLLGLAQPSQPPVAQSAESTNAPLSLSVGQLRAATAKKARPARLRIGSPRGGKAVRGSTVKVTWSVSGAKMIPAAEAKERTDRHAYVLLDRDVARFVGTGRPIPREDANIVHTAERVVTFHNVAPGTHRIDLLLAYADHVAVDPPVVESVTFTVVPDEKAPPAPTTTPTATVAATATPTPSPTATATPLPGSGTVVDATIANYVYLPDPIRVTLGGTIRWTNLEDVPDDHTVTASDRSWTSPVIEYRGTWSRAFTERGTFSYFCEPHPFMVGEIVVE